MTRLSDLLRELEKLSSSVAKTLRRAARLPEPRQDRAAQAPEHAPAARSHEQARDSQAPQQEQPTTRPSQPSNEVRSRTLHLGLDYGTSYSKLILRDYEAVAGERSHVVFPPTATGRSPDFRIASLISLDGDRLWFGHQAAGNQALPHVQSYPSVKIRMALPDQFHGVSTPFPDGFNADAFATLMVAYLLQEGRRAAEQIANRYRSIPRMSFTLGVPMSDCDNPHLAGRFVDVARRAWQIVKNPSAPDLRKGIVLHEARGLLDAAAAAIAHLADPDARNWIRSEVEAALLWPFKSADTEPGLYAAVDVGAGTTSASFFHIAVGKTGMAFFGTSCLAPGGDAIDEALLGFANASDPAALRTKENDILSLSGDTPVQAILEQISKTYRQAFGRSYAKNKRQSAWEGYRLFLTGGGTEINVLRRKLGVRAWLNLHGDPEILDVGAPPDLDLEGIEDRDLKFLMVAYGLSHFDADVPEVDLPGDIEPLILKKPREIEMDGEPESFRPHVRGTF